MERSSIVLLKNLLCRYTRPSHKEKARDLQSLGCGKSWSVLWDLTKKKMENTFKISSTVCWAHESWNIKSCYYLLLPTYSIIFFFYPTVTFNYGCFLVQCYVTKNHPDKTKSDPVWIELPWALCLEQFSPYLIKIRLGLDFKYTGLISTWYAIRIYL